MKILVADDHHLIVNGLKRAIEQKYPDGSVDLAVKKSELDYLLKQTTYDILILDVKYGDLNAKTFIQPLKAEYPQLKILILSSLDDKYTIEFFYNSGVQGYIVKSESIVEILSGISHILKGERYFSEELLSKMKGRSTDIILTPREKDVLAIILEEKSTKEIADELGISEKTVEMHRANLFQKLAVKNVTGLVKKSILLNLLD